MDELHVLCNINLINHVLVAKFSLIISCYLHNFFNHLLIYFLEFIYNFSNDNGFQKHIYARLNNSHQLN